MLRAQSAIWDKSPPSYLFHKMGVGRIRRVKCGLATEARKRSQAREGEGRKG